MAALVALVAAALVVRLPVGIAVLPPVVGPRPAGSVSATAHASSQTDFVSRDVGFRT